MTDDPMKLLEEARDKLAADAFQPGDTDGFRHINYCRHCHYSESHGHGDDCIISRIDRYLATGGERIQHKVTCLKFPDPFDERDPVGPCTCGAEPLPKKGE